MPDVPVKANGKRPPKPSLTPITNRLTVVEQIYHQQSTGEPMQFSRSYSRQLLTDEQTYERRQQPATEQWSVIDLGWIKQTGCGLLTISHEGEPLSVIPTPEEKAKAAARVLEVCYEGSEDSPWLIDPKESMRVRPSKLEGLRIRCQSGSAKYSICAFPK